jgi:hypothetical protein
MSMSLPKNSDSRASFILAGNYLGDIMDCALNESAPVAISATEVFDCIVRGGLAAPNDVLSDDDDTDFRLFPLLLLLRPVRFPEFAKLPLELECG